DPDEFVAFLGAQSDLSPKSIPRFVRVTEGLPSTATQKVLKRVLRHEHWECDDPVWWRPDRAWEFQLLSPEAATALRSRFVERGREHLLGG
ncbi:MAG: fatty-acyl-CoA synthase, partial [Actinomycetota bacterium]|nr:fatty-acyl-CoA synthase [Actinomycetota bacterium]